MRKKKLKIKKIRNLNHLAELDEKIKNCFQIY
jgi:hypothetical protein